MRLAWWNLFRVGDRQPHRIVFGNGDRPVLEFTPLEQAVSNHSKSLLLSPGVRENLQIFIDSIPRVANLGRDIYYATHQRVILCLPAHLLNSTDSWDFMRVLEQSGAFRGTIVNKFGRVIGQASFKPDQVLCFASFGAALWQVAAMMTSQRYLVDINGKLGHLRTTTESIHQFLEDAQYGQVLGNVRYLEQIALQLQAGTQEAGILHQLETIERESLQLLEAIRPRLERNFNNVRNIHPDVWSFDRNCQEIEACLNDFQEIAKILYLLCDVRISALRLKSALPGDCYCRIRLSAISLDQACIEERTQAFFDEVNQHIDCLCSHPLYFLGEKERKEAKQKLAERVSAFSNACRDAMQNTKDLIHSLEEAFEPNSSVLRLEIQLAEGKITDICQCED